MLLGVVLAISVMCPDVSGVSRTQSLSDPLSGIPAQERARLMERLNLVIKYQGFQQWERIYDLLSLSARGGRNIENYVAWRKEFETPPISTVLAFAPSEAIKIDESTDGGTWLILGCARYRRKGRIVRIKSDVTVELMNKEWFFSEIGPATQIDGPEQPCSMPKRKRRRA